MTIRDKILIIEDEPTIANFMRAILETRDYEVMIVQSGAMASTLIASHCPDLIILDLGLPDMDGMQLLKAVRQWSKVPVVVVSARSHERDKVAALDAGADDYLTKPFNILELKARIRALLRRAGRSEEKAAGNSLTIGTITLDLDARNAYRNGQLADLTAKEFDVIEFLMRNPNRVYSREALLDTIWAYEYRSDIRTVDVHIRRLREKLEENPAEPKYILTKWGVGYYFRK